MDNMREDFEKWAVNVYGTARMGFAAGFYSRDEVQWAWQAWQASRKALVVELPQPNNDGEDSLMRRVEIALDKAGVGY